MKLHQLCLLLLLTGNLAGQGIGIGTSLPDSSSIVEIESISKGVLLTRLTTSQRNLIEDPVQGLLVFDTDKNTLYLFDGNKWLPLMYTTDPNTIPLSSIGDVSDAASGDSLGYAVDIDGDYAIVGAPYDNIDADDDQGSAYIFYKGDGAWEEQAKLTVPLGAADDHFGISVSISGDYAIIGAPHTNLGGTDRGNAFVFRRNGTNWLQVARLNAFDGMAGDFFGHAVSIDGDYAVVGAYNAETVGRAYVFYRDTGWALNQLYQAKLIPSVALNSNFGWSVDLFGDEAFVGAPVENVDGDVARGAAYVFTRSGTTWPQTARIYAHDGNPGDAFGFSVSMTNIFAGVGAPFDDVGSNGEQGSAYIFYGPGGWSDDQPFFHKLTAPDGNAFDLFGTSVCISDNNYVVVGAPQKSTTSYNFHGGAYLYELYTFELIKRKLDDQTIQAYARFGKSVSIDGYNIIVGAPFKNEIGQVQYLNIE